MPFNDIGEPELTVWTLFFSFDLIGTNQSMTVWSVQ
jgi:hypothetical protein